MTAISKNVYINNLDDIENEYNNTYHRTIKMKHILTYKHILMHMLTLKKKLMMKVLNLKLVIM